MGFLDRFTAKFAPPDVLEDTETAFRAKVIVTFSFAVSIWGPIYSAVLYALAESVAAAVTLLTATVIIGGTPFLMKMGVPFRYLGHWIALNTFLIVNAVAWLGFGSESVWWQSIVVILAVLLCGVRTGLFWLVASIIHLIVFFRVAASGDIAAVAFDGDMQLIWQASVMSGLYVIVGLLTLAYESLKTWALESIRTRQALTEAILRAAPDGIITVLGNGRIEQVNDATVAIFGYDEPEELTDLPLCDLVPSAAGTSAVFAEYEQSIEFIDWINDTIQDRRVDEGRRRDGSDFPVDVSIRDIGADGRYVVVLRDITELQMAQKTLENARDAAMQANQAKSTFLANMSHELRTPLNAIIGYSELLCEDAEDLGQDAFVPDLQKIRVAGKHLLNLINDILDISKIEAGHMDLYIEQVDLRQILNEVAATVEPVIHQNDSTFTVDIERAPVHLQADSTKLRQILLNLLSNAAKFAGSSTVELRVFTEFAEDVQYCVFEVEDHGIGIAPEKIDKLFKAFEQADVSTTRLYGGTGLGLAISKRFTEMMGGEISVESTLGEGTTFRIDLPVQLDKPVQDDEPTAQHDRVTRTTSMEVAEDALSVLVIDDDPIVHQLMGEFLGREGFRMHSATDGAMGIEMAQELEPDVITLDVMMSKMDGWNVLGKLKSDPKIEKIPVVMVSIVNDKNMGYSLGAADYLVKPVDRKRLVKVLGRYARHIGEQPVMLVEDDALASEMMMRTIEREGWQACCASDGVEALRMLENGLRPGVMLLDIMMPNMDGFEMLDRLKANPEWADIPVVVVSAAVLTTDERERLSMHVEQILQKGEYTPSELVEQVRRVARQA
jgi:PAS domain S-box-containing protein